MSRFITDEQWRQYDEVGYLRLGKLLNEAELAALQQRIDDIMLGKANVNYDRMMMQLDSSTGNYGDAGKQTKGFKMATLNYRKIEELEFDPLFLKYMQHPVFREACVRIYGPETPISCFRAMFMNKPARKGTVLPWHQDRWTFLDRDPLVTIYTALDPATTANGCVKIIPGSHRMGLINPSHGSGFLTQEQAERICTPDKAMYFEMQAGEVSLLHNWVLHSSEVNRSDIARRAFSVCYMDARTKASNGAAFSVIFGEGALVPQELETVKT
ncbi:MAG: phytanoyl-CoA dioxygenase family protein [Planctomycetes bacterium]|nr:phytanoyl-CoA dioxygenase family protein [Planctomycetota bacterium]